MARRMAVSIFSNIKIKSKKIYFVLKFYFKQIYKLTNHSLYKKVLEELFFFYGKTTSKKSGSDFSEL